MNESPYRPSFSDVLCYHQPQEANFAVVEMTVDSTQQDFLAVAAEIVVEVVVGTDSVEDSEAVAGIDSVQTVYFAAAMTEARSAVPSLGYPAQ